MVLPLPMTGAGAESAPHLGHYAAQAALANPNAIHLSILNSDTIQKTIGGGAQGDEQGH